MYQKEEKKDYFDRLITDETWINHYDPKPKDQSKQWKRCDSPTTKKERVTPSASNNIMVTGFSDQLEVMEIDFLAKGILITGPETVCLSKARGVECWPEATPQME